MDFLKQINIKTAKNLAKQAKTLIYALNSGQKICFISDEKIWQNCARFFADDFLATCHQALILKDPRPDEKNIAAIENALFAKNCDLIIALGSGVISDLCKFVSAQTKIPYAIFPSAASMNGYLSRNASIIVRGHKKTLSATLPIAVFCDLEILKSAPANMIKAGIADSLCFYNCWFDWKLSHLILNTKFDPQPFLMLQEKMDFFINNYKKFRLKDDLLLEILIDILMLSGSGMTMAQGSYPASQSEHMIAHAFEMKYPQIAHEILHGLQIAATTMTTAAIQERLALAKNVCIKENDFSYKKIAEIFDEKIAAECQKEFTEKFSFNIEHTNSHLRSSWVDIGNDLRKLILGTQKLQEIFMHFEIKFDADSLNISPAQYLELIEVARYTRNRFTCLDLSAVG